MTVPVAHDIAALRKLRAALPGSVALVPTMGALHAGHRALLDTAAARADHVVVSIFVNPLQFGPHEDLDRYPRTLDADLRMCEQAGAAAVFAPPASVMYPRPIEISVDPGPMGTVLEGAHRPGHFAGVLTVVLKLLMIATPDVAVFGRKDGQQLALVRRMVADLDIDTDIVAAETVREPDGLALSSRNRYLSDTDRGHAGVLSAALSAGTNAATGGPAAALRAARDTLAHVPAARVDYVALVDPETMMEIAGDFTGTAMLAVAARVGETRLIDNVPIDFPASRPATGTDNRR